MWKSTLCALILGGGSLPGLAADPAADLSPVVAVERGRIQEAVSLKQLPDLQLACARDGKIIWSQVFHGALGATATTETRFRIGSVSKCITATALLREAEQGKIDLQRPITDYLACDIPQAGQMTARMLAGHLAGIRHYQGTEAINFRHYDTLQSGLAIFSTSPLVAAPGTTFHYSSYGFNLLGCVMEGAAKESFPALVDEQVLQPLHMNHTEVDDLTKPLPALAPTFARLSDGSVLPVQPTDDSYKWPSGGYVSTAEDLVALGNAYLQPGYLSPASIAAAETPQVTTTGKSTGYSLGWNVAHDAAGNLFISHTGEAQGGEALLAVWPARKIVFAAVWNVSRADIMPVLNRVDFDLAHSK